MKRSYLHVLMIMSRRPQDVFMPFELPNGNGHRGNGRYASNVTIADMASEGLISRELTPGRSLGWKITTTGLAELANRGKTP